VARLVHTKPDITKISTETAKNVIKATTQGLLLQPVLPVIFISQHTELWSIGNANAMTVAFTHVSSVMAQLIPKVKLIKVPIIEL
jgi:hypothetical protein